MKDIISPFICKGEPAGKFNPSVEVWSEMAVRMCVLRALKSAGSNKAFTRLSEGGAKSAVKRVRKSKVISPAKSG